MARDEETAGMCGVVEAPDEAADSGMDLLWMADSVLRLLPLSGNVTVDIPLGCPGVTL